MDLTPGTIVKDRYCNPKTLRDRHLAIMEEMVKNPHLKQSELAKKVGYTDSRLSIIINSPLFIYAFREYRRVHMNKVSDLVAEATAAALRFSKEVIEDKDIDVVCRQESARDILDQGHAKAVERTASANFEVQVPLEALGGLEKILAEMSQPFKPTRMLKLTPSNGDGESE